MSQPKQANADGQPPDDLMKLQLGLLKKGPTWSAQVTPEVESNQRQHLALLSQLARQGHLLLAGPTPSESDLRGIIIIRAEREAEARALFQDDAHISSDRLRLEIHPLYLSKANLTRPLLGE